MVPVGPKRQTVPVCFEALSFLKILGILFVHIYLHPLPIIWSSFFSQNTSRDFLAFKNFSCTPYDLGPVLLSSTRLSFSLNLCQARKCLALLPTPPQNWRRHYDVLCLWCQFKIVLQNATCSLASFLLSKYLDLFVSKKDEFRFP
jgi:hypothetical protein